MKTRILRIEVTEFQGKYSVAVDREDIGETPADFVPANRRREVVLVTPDYKESQAMQDTLRAEMFGEPLHSTATQTSRPAS